MSDTPKQTLARINKYMPYAVLVTFILCVIGLTLIVLQHSTINKLHDMAVQNNDLLEGRTPLFQKIVDSESGLSERLGVLEGKVDFILLELQTKADKPYIEQ